MTRPDDLAPEVAIADAQRPAVVRLSFNERLGCIQVRLDDPPQIHVSGLVYPQFMRELTGYFQDLAGRPPSENEELRRVSSNDDELCVEAWPDAPGMVGLAISLAEDMWDPNWVVRVNLIVAQADLLTTAASIERLARFVEGTPQLPDDELGNVADPLRDIGSGSS